jgi:hypothetical protein
MIRPILGCLSRDEEGIDVDRSQQKALTMSYEKDQSGCPVDPAMQRLISHLGELAARWRGSRKDGLVQEYHTTMQQLYDLGWDDDIDMDGELPDELMPEEYLKRNNRSKNPNGDGHHDLSWPC